MISVLRTGGSGNAEIIHGNGRGRSMKGMMAKTSPFRSDDVIFVLLFVSVPLLFSREARRVPTLFRSSTTPAPAAEEGDTLAGCKPRSGGGDEANKTG